MVILKGEPIVPRLAFGRARLALKRRGVRRRGEPRTAGPEQEEERLHKAVGRLGGRMGRMYEIARSKMGEAEAQIFQVHQEMLVDPLFQDEIIARVRGEGLSAEGAVQAALDLFRDRYSRSDEEKIRFMAAELTSIGDDLLDELEGAAIGGSGANTPEIVFVQEITPRLVMRAGIEGVVGFVARSGGQTAHATILARALDVPVVANVEDWGDSVADGCPVILDGTAGTVILEPTEERERIYRDLENRLEETRLEMLEERSLPSTTRDGCAISLQANLTMTGETEAVERFGADGVGLFRSELSYMLRNRYPGEDELTGIYRVLSTRLSPKFLTMRTLDVGGDKTPGYFDLPATRNPLLGMRSGRLLKIRRVVLETQFRAILRASAESGNFRLLFPFIGSIEEWREVKESFHGVRNALKASGTPFQEALPLGLMIELPSAALSARALLAEADFASIGTNDLTQYTFGVDRSQSEVASFYRPVSPPMLEMIRMVVDAGRETGKPVSLCGEVAANPRYTALLIGLGLRALSMNVEAIPLVRARVRALDVVACEELAGAVLAESTVAGIEAAIDAFIVPGKPADG